METREKTEDRGLRTEDGGSETQQAAVCQAMEEACAGCSLLYERRATGAERRSCPACCGNCAYAGRMRDGDACVPICANTPSAPGEIVRIDPAGKCPNYCRKPQPVIRGVPPQPTDDGIRYIPLTRGKYAMVDAADYPWLSEYKWHVVAPGKEYAGRKQQGKTVYMHREIMQPPLGMMVDHIDGNSLNNCRRNLRNCTNQQNMQNIRKSPRVGSRYKGVYYDKRRRTFSAKICHNGKSYHLGTFATEIEAARAYDRKALELFGEFARLNFPDAVRQESVARPSWPVARAAEAGEERVE